MLDVYVYKGRDNRVPLRLRSQDVTGQSAIEPPLQGASRITLDTSNGFAYDSAVDPEIEVLDDSTLSLWLGPDFLPLEEGEPIFGYLTVFYADRENGVAWPGSTDAQNRPTFRFIPVGWAVVA